MVFDSEAVCFVLDPGDQLKAFGMRVDRQFDIMEVKPPGPVVVILDHAADRDLQSKLFHNAFRDVHLPPASVHHDQVREYGERAHLPVRALLLQLCRLPDPMGKASCQDFLKGSIIVRAFDCLYAELSVVRCPGLSVLEYDHGSYRLDAARIGDIVCLHAADVGKSKQTGYLLHGADRPSFLHADPLSVLFQNDLGIFPGHRDQFLLGPSLRNPDADRFSPSKGHPPLQKFPVVDLRLQHDLGGQHHVPRVELPHEVGQDRLLILIQSYADK